MPRIYINKDNTISNFPHPAVLFLHFPTPSPCTSWAVLYWIQVGSVLIRNSLYKASVNLGSGFVPLTWNILL